MRDCFIQGFGGGGGGVAAFRLMGFGAFGICRFGHFRLRAFEEFRRFKVRDLCLGFRV